MNTIKIAAAALSVGAVAALGLAGRAAADPVPDGGYHGVTPPCAAPGPSSFDYDAYIAARKAQLSWMRAPGWS